MKNRFKIVVVSLITIFGALYVSAQSGNMYAVSRVPLTNIASGNYDDSIVNISGNTGKQIRGLVENWVQERTRKTLKEVMALNETKSLTKPHYNTQSKKGGLQVYFDRSPEDEALCYNGEPLIKWNCCNLVSNDPGLLRNILSSFAAGKTNSNSNGQLYNQPNQQNCNTNSNPNNQKSMDSSTLHIVVSGANTAANNVVTSSDSSFPWGWIIFFGLLVLAIAGIIIYAIYASGQSRRESDRNSAISRVREANTLGQEVLRNHYDNMRTGINFTGEVNTFARTQHNAWTPAPVAVAPAPVAPVIVTPVPAAGMTTTTTTTTTTGPTPTT